jgi:hypothetical protein
VNVAEDLKAIGGTWHGTPPEALFAVSDEDEVETLAAQMAERRSWVGAPLVLDGELALNGANGLAAARDAKVEQALDGKEFVIPTIDADDLCERWDLDWATLQARADAAHGAGRGVFEAVHDLAGELPPEVTTYLGLHRS